MIHGFSLHGDPNCQRSGSGIKLDVSLLRILTLPA
jgi:hypothetical protein